MLLVDIHDVESDQIRGLADVQVRSWKAAYRGIIPDAHLDAMSVDESEKRWRASASHTSPTTIVVAESMGTVVGFASYGPCRDPDWRAHAAEVYALYVDPERYGQSIGGSLMAHALNSFRRNGYRRAALWVLERNAHARSFYEHKLWLHEGSRKTIQFGNVSVDEVRYEHRLASPVYL
ncbi:MAG TPA: GNAT family N-acetyltransferase [Polyangiaceae bacterium]|jgi:GNAT superfamily N-acetyltransferase